MPRRVEITGDLNIRMIWLFQGEREGEKLEDANSVELVFVHEKCSASWFG